jgi:hypothetical protein
VAQSIFLIQILYYRGLKIGQQPEPYMQYLLFIFFIVAMMKSVTGLLWIYGINSMSATHFLVLAKSPLEVWQRGSVFIADFLFNKIYLPVWRRFRNLWLSSILVIVAIFVHLFVFHEVLIKTILRFQFGDVYFSIISFSEIFQWLIWALVWLVWIGIFSVFLKLTQAWHQNRLFLWLLVLLTHLGSSAIFPVVTYLIGIVAV